MRALLASPLGFLIGISLGSLGGGGSILAVPALVYAAGQTPTHATTTSLVLVAITAVFGLIPHWRAHRVRFGAGTAFGLSGIGGSLIGSHANKTADPDALLLAFSGLMMVAAYAMWRRLSVPTTPVDRTRGAPAVSTGPAVPAVSAVSTITVAAGPERRFVAPAPPRSELSTVAVHPGMVSKVIVAGSLVGLLTGFFGVGGGFVIVPALVLALGFTMSEAVGTSLLVITINSVVALATRLHAGAIEWGTVIPFTLASVLGVVVGSRLASTRDSASLQRWFIGLLVVVAIYTGVRSGLAL